MAKHDANLMLSEANVVCAVALGLEDLNDYIAAGHTLWITKNAPSEIRAGGVDISLRPRVAT